MALYLSSFSLLAATTSVPFSITNWPRCPNAIRLVGCCNAGVPRHAQVAYEYDPELRIVLELATDDELYELQRILFGPSYFSPLLKSVLNRDDVEDIMIEEDVEEREAFIEGLESRFLFLAADARSTLRGWRPSYRNVLLSVRKKLNIPCSSKLTTEDLEAEIFLHLLREYSSEKSGIFPGLWENDDVPNIQNSLELGLSQWKVQVLAAGKVGAAEIQSMILKGGGMVTLTKLYQLLGKKLSGKVFLEAANYLMKKEALKKGGQIAAINVESRAALLAAKQGLAGAASRYVGLRSMMNLLGPLFWGTFMADVVIQMLGTDYARILRAIYGFAQVFQRERLNGHYGVTAFVIGNTLSAMPFLIMITFISETICYFMVHLHPGFEHYLFFVLCLYASVTVVESLMMAIASIVPNFLMGIIIGAGIQGIFMLVSGYFRLPHDIPKPVWRYPMSYISFHFWALQGQYQNDLKGLMFDNQSPDLPKIYGEYILEYVFQITVTRSKWIDLSVLFSMIVIYRIIFFFMIKISEDVTPWIRGLIARRRMQQKNGTQNTMVAPDGLAQSPSLRGYVANRATKR